MIYNSSKASCSLATRSQAFSLAEGPVGSKEGDLCSYHGHPLPPWQGSSHMGPGTALTSELPLWARSQLYTSQANMTQHPK